MVFKPKASLHEGEIHEIEIHNHELVKSHPREAELLPIATARQAIIDAEHAKEPKLCDPELMEVRECAFARPSTAADVAQLQEDGCTAPDPKELVSPAEVEQDLVEWKDYCLRWDLRRSFERPQALQAFLKKVAKAAKEIDTESEGTSERGCCGEH